MRIEELDYDLPRDLIAQRPAPRREDARLMHVRRRDGSITDRSVRDLPELLAADDLLVVNDSRVRAARLRARRLDAVTGAPAGQVELLVLEPVDDRPGRWRCLARPARRLRPGTRVVLAGDRVVTVEHPEGDGVVVVSEDRPGDVEAACEQAGEAPLPPYVRSPIPDPDRYQTVYADRMGSSAAPTAGLHLGDDLWPLLRRRFEVVTVTLHVGMGTFRRVSAATLAAHRMHGEAYDVPPATLAALGAARAADRRVVCVGTTAVRVVETLARGGAPTGRTDLMLSPADPPRVVGALLTNLHEPRSTLIALVMGFAGPELVRRAYAHAVAGRYRFLSLGDATFWE